MLVIWSEIKCVTQLFVRVPAITHRGTNYTKNTHLESSAALFGINLRARATGNYHCKFSMSSLISSSNFRLWANETWIFHTRAGFSLSAPDNIARRNLLATLEFFFRPSVIGEMINFRQQLSSACLLLLCKRVMEAETLAPEAAARECQRCRAPRNTFHNNITFGCVL